MMNLPRRVRSRVRFGARQAAINARLRRVAVATVFVAAMWSMPHVGRATENTPSSPNFVLCMADDQGWGDVGHRDPALKTPTLDELAATALRLDRFYAAAPVCSPTRGSVMTGRHPNRFGCFSWGHTLRPEEITVAEALQSAGYATGHFGKWHLGPVTADSPVSPGASGFDNWLSAPNFFENSPLLSREGKVIQTTGEGSQVVVDATLAFIRDCAARKQPFLAVVWFGSPHAPHVALDADRAPYANLPANKQNFYGEITAMDRAIGNLRKQLRELNLAENTLLWYTSDNGALPVGSTGGLRGRKSELYEGGIRVPCMLEWPSRIREPRASSLPCGSVDIYPTVLELAGVRLADQVQPLDGVSLAPLIEGKMQRREKPLGFWVHPTRGIGTPSDAILRALLREQQGKPPADPPAASIAAEAVNAEARKKYPKDELPGHSAWIDGDWKLHRIAGREGNPRFSLYNLEDDAEETTDLAQMETDRVARMRAALEAWQRSVVRSLNGEDYAPDSPSQQR